jgi:hypothetical protein
MEANGQKECLKANKPCARCLFQTVERFIQFAHMSGLGRINKARGLSTIIYFREINVEKDVLDI